MDRVVRRARATIQSSVLVAFGQKPGVAGEDDGLSTLGDVEFGEAHGDVVGDGLRRQVELLADLGVGEAAGELSEDVGFPRTAGWGRSCGVGMAGRTSDGFEHADGAVSGVTVQCRDEAGQMASRRRSAPLVPSRSR